MQNTPEPLEHCRNTAFLDQAPPRHTGLPDRLLDESGRPFGPALAKLTPWRHHLLLGFNSPLVTGRPCFRAHLLQALYLCSIDFRPGSRLAFALFRVRWFWFTIRCGHVARNALEEWLRAPFQCMPPLEVPQEGKGAAPVEADEAWLATLMQLGRGLGFRPYETLHVPYVVLWDNLAAKWAGSGDKNRPKFNRKRDRQIKEYLRAKREKGGA